MKNLDKNKNVLVYFKILLHLSFYLEGQKLDKKMQHISIRLSCALRQLFDTPAKIMPISNILSPWSKC
jgi:hypothetical protein